MPLVRSRDPGPQCDLLVPVRGVDIHPVVVDPDVVVGVAGGDGDLERGGEEVRVRGDVEGVEGGILEDEAGLVGVEDGPGDEHDDEEDEEDHRAVLEHPPPELPPLTLAVLGAARHSGAGVSVVVAGLGRWWRVEEGDGGKRSLIAGKGDGEDILIDVKFVCVKFNIT